ncbi:MAG TPA: GTP diphosphokinase, partial [Halieaceae bacterium]|nr:GTP diphosphokinase [Halieaceae bacterium]
MARPGLDLDDWCAESDCLLAGLETAQILAELQVSADCLIAGLLYRAVREERLPLDRVEERFGSATAQLLEGVLRMAAVSDLRKTGDERVLGQADAQRDNLRKMLVAIVDDVRVALIKLAERTCAIRAVKNDRERREPIARE